jgi:hypothetical protein
LPTTPIIVARAEPGLLAHFPDIVALADGRLLVTWREGAGHVRSDGSLRLAESADNGETWSRPWTAVDGDFDDRDPKLAVLGDGTILLSYFVLDWSTKPHTNLGTYVRRSEDAGRTWSEPARVASAAEADGGWVASHGAAVELPGGDILQPVYGKAAGDDWERATVLRSTDGGRSFGDEVLLAAADGLHFQEPHLVVAAGQVIAVIRATDGAAWLARSYDDGRSWSAPERTDIPASSHHALALDTGAVLLTYGDVSERFSKHRESVGRLVRDPAGSWDKIKDIQLYDSEHRDQANPSSAPAADRFLTVGFDVPAATVVGVFSHPDDY